MFMEKILCKIHLRKLLSEFFLHIHAVKQYERVNFMYSIDLQSRTPIYEQLYKKVVELILKRELMPDDKLPSVRELAKELGINPNTVSKAFQLLERDKVIYSLAGRGSFVANVNAETVRDAALSDFDKAVSEALTVGITKGELTERINRTESHEVISADRR